MEQTRQTGAASGRGGTGSGDGLRVATLNLWGLRGDWRRRRSALRTAYRDAAPDLVAFQECVRTDAYDQARDVLGDGYHYAYQHDRAADGQGVTTASRWPIETCDEVDLQVGERTAGFACTALLTGVTAPGPVGRVLLVNNLPSWRLDVEYEREVQAVRTARAVEHALAEHRAHAVVMGDFDADPHAASIRFWTGRQSLDAFSVCYRDAWESAHPGEAGATYGTGNPLGVDWDWPFHRIDYVLVRCGRYGGPTLAVRRCDLLFDAPIDGVWVSDHHGLLADLAVPKPIDPAEL